MSVTNETLAGLVRPDSVHKRLYTDPAIFALEMERIYGRAWIYVGHESQVKTAGDYHTTRIGDQDVVMVRASDGTIHVIYNRCPHKGAKVVPDGDGSVGKFFRCPYHAWTFRHDGTHLSAPLRNGLQNTCFDPKHPDFSMRRVARVDSYRGFVFASQSNDGPDLRTFLNGVVSSIDNLCDRSPVGEVEVTGGVFRVLQRSNWKVFYENLHDTMHAPVTHESSVVSARAQAAEMGAMPFELLIMDGNGEPYEFWEKLELRAYAYGHGYMEGIFDPAAAERDSVSSAHFAVLAEVYGEERARRILGMNRHNTVIYGSGSPHTVFQQFRVIRPIAVDRTLVEIQLFRLKGAPDAVFDRALTYANVINSPSSNVMPDDVEVYARCQEGNQTRGGEWVSMHRYAGTDRATDDGFVSINGTSELPMRNQFAAWKHFMVDEAAPTARTREGDA
ncbi:MULTISPECIES: aromatic ring-hydroxylating dioxygenase subunit alpha [Burkholderia]|uniref:aromatic ring-hydroxylating dioxygenase subunit alpha n=1 Tax=Burkholderia TaxID=32008 RepID=UPI001589775B|nr:aromatic ring-hydroxylating dioxygenase subunit alpha [Burkholderia cepacia]EMD9439891.1 Rieske 2Fe-2S domain-containing protein [Burkholderia cepacia]MCA8054843.1 aromatic ring-hydroxylating dioxygenase subunit alpha [Burkholderia cepacia]MCA8132693.1 aromatic ring-hydroxylating dioxygenase subunit alpha [Burkholderia cepacia]MCA8161017.1 aromatic ring-hydroxylating dioxygenase subunit alpha [Burkholderia cepacia]HEM7895651.1 Rieske 2Fe-2S domain-containing protein [Burkholderia cepacia]